MKDQVVFSLEIRADAHVSKCDIVYSELVDTELDRKLVARVRQIDFGAQDADVWRDTFYVDLFPS